MKRWIRTSLPLLAAALAAACAAPGPVSPGKPEYIVVGIDEKTVFADDASVKSLPPGKDRVEVMDIGTDPAHPRVVASLPLMNTVVGPPTNLAVTPDMSLALVANSLDWQQDGSGWKGVPDNKLYVIDLTASPPRVIDTVAIGKQPSGLSINRRGDLALVANRADNSISVLAIQGRTVRLVDTVAIGEQVASVAFTPDGRRALVTKFPGNKIALLAVDGQKVTYDKRDLPVGLWPYNVNVTPDGRLGLTADNGNAGRSDGNVDTVSVIDLEANPPRVIDHVVVGDAPEGFAVSPKGDLAVAVLLGGSDGPHDGWFYQRGGRLVTLRIDGKQVTRTGEIAVGAIPEGALFSPDGRWFYVGNFADKTMSVFRVEGDRLVPAGTPIPLAGSPASMRGRVQ